MVPYIPPLDIYFHFFMHKEVILFWKKSIGSSRGVWVMIGRKHLPVIPLFTPTEHFTHITHAIQEICLFEQRFQKQKASIFFFNHLVLHESYLVNFPKEYHLLISKRWARRSYKLDLVCCHFFYWIFLFVCASCLLFGRE